MKRLGNTRAEEAYRSTFVLGLPKNVGYEAHQMIHLLMAAHSWQDAGVIGRIAEWSNYPGRYGLRVEGKWFLTFEWHDLMGAVEIKLERR